MLTKLNRKVIIIGAGFGGLAAAALLGKAGFNVLVLEKNKTIGGRARVFKKKGFTFDMGPSWYLMPDIFERFFANFDKKPTDFFTLKRLNPAYRMFFDKKKTIDIAEKLSDNVKLFDSLEKGGGKKFLAYLDDSKTKYDIAISGFIYKEYRNFFDLFNKKLMRGGSQLDIFQSIDKFVQKFFKSDFARKILEYNIVFLGGNPDNTPALYSIMAHIDFNLGVWYPIGGMGKLVTALEKLAKKYKVKIVTGSEVTRIITEYGHASGVMVGRKKYLADIVIANADYPHVETKLLEKSHQSYDEKYWGKRVVAPSAFCIYLGVKGKVTGLTHHNLFVENDWMKHFDHIFKDPSWPESFSYYVSCPSKSDPSIAPKYTENLFVLVPIAAGLKDTPQMREKYFKKILGMLETTLKENIEDRIIVKEIFSVNDFKKDYNAYKGTALGLTHTLMQSAIFRPSMRSKKVENLFYVGQYTHPGIGVPMVMIAAEVISKSIIKEFGE